MPIFRLISPKWLKWSEIPGGGAQRLISVFFVSSFIRHWGYHITRGLWKGYSVVFPNGCLCTIYINYNTGSRIIVLFNYWYIIFYNLHCISCFWNNPHIHTHREADSYTNLCCVFITLKYPGRCRGVCVCVWLVVLLHVSVYAVCVCFHLLASLLQVDYIQDQSSVKATML